MFLLPRKTSGGLNTDPANHKNAFIVLLLLGTGHKKYAYISYYTFSFREQDVAHTLEIYLKASLARKLYCIEKRCYEDYLPVTELFYMILYVA